MGVLTPTVQGNTTSATPGLEPGRSLYSRRVAGEPPKGPPAWVAGEPPGSPATCGKRNM